MDGGNGIPGGLLGLDMSLQPHQQMHQQQGSHSQQQQQPLIHHHLQQTHHMLPFQDPMAKDSDHQGQHPVRHAQYVSPLGHVRSEEEPRYGEDVDEQGRRGGVPSQPSSSASPWHRMKWTDGMVRLLIQVVYHVGDDGGGAEGEQQQPHGTVAKGKKSASASAPVSALLQKKGKWKSVSRAMMEKGFYVSPQQCEDKFNDLNKRYKRVNDLLGKGTACRVVENQALLDTMDLSPKAKEEARKLLNSKHLFFREMCAYHNAGVSTCAAAPPPQIPLPAPSDQQQLCFHHPPGLVDMEREMERMKLDNERLCLENDRMLLLLRQKELELTHGGSGVGGSSAAIPSAEQQQLMLQNTNTNQRRPAEQPHIPNADHASTTA
ncbi:hypothetical protein C4D60_Mb10t14550 [Musa balbisiana]|uniref:Myb/SANT-like DNA-binding domain-containing protein n=1 Tax=Musa balbisiana TaxID=52838 RepID=A0A4S8IX54_MUSBA|nr:hypothetical protein C4D60_Mb10t14550 [Musa balbisiana]